MKNKFVFNSFHDWSLFKFKIFWFCSIFIISSIFSGVVGCCFCIVVFVVLCIFFESIQFLEIIINFWPDIFSDRIHCAKRNFGLTDFYLKPLPLIYFLSELVLFWFMLFPIRLLAFLSDILYHNFVLTAASKVLLFLLLLCTVSIWKWTPVSFKLLFCSEWCEKVYRYS